MMEFAMYSIIAMEIIQTISVSRIHTETLLEKGKRKGDIIMAPRKRSFWNRSLILYFVLIMAMGLIVAMGCDSKDDKNRGMEDAPEVEAPPALDIMEVEPNDDIGEGSQYLGTLSTDAMFTVHGFISDTGVGPDGGTDFTGDEDVFTLRIAEAAEGAPIEPLVVQVTLSWSSISDFELILAERFSWPGGSYSGISFSNTEGMTSGQPEYFQQLVYPGNEYFVWVAGPSGAPGAYDLEIKVITPVDADCDGFYSVATGGIDCNDDPNFFGELFQPCSQDIAGDLLDTNCSGVDMPTNPILEPTELSEEDDPGTIDLGMLVDGQAKTVLGSIYEFNSETQGAFIIFTGDVDEFSFSNGTRPGTLTMNFQWCVLAEYFIVLRDKLNNEVGRVIIEDTHMEKSFRLAPNQTISLMIAGVSGEPTDYVLTLLYDEKSPSELRDLDGDGFYSILDGGDDCDDSNRLINPCTGETPGDGIDQNCDGQDAEFDSNGEYTYIEIEEEEGDNDFINTYETLPGLHPDYDITVFGEILVLGEEDPQDNDLDIYYVRTPGIGCEQWILNARLEWPDTASDFDLLLVYPDGFFANQDGATTNNPEEFAHLMGNCEDILILVDGFDGNPGPYTLTIDLEATVDADGDCYSSLLSGGDDCDDSNANIRPCGEEILGNGIDENCSGSDYPTIIPDVDIENPEPNDDILFPVVLVGGLDVVQGTLSTLALSSEGFFIGDFDNFLITTPSYGNLRLFLEWCDPNANMGFILQDNETGDPIGDAQYFETNFLEVNLLLTGGIDIAAAVTGISGPDNTHYYLTVQHQPIDSDVDDDGYDAIEFGGDDCDDTNPYIHPCASEFGGDGVDSDCSGADRTWHPPFIFDEVEPNDDIDSGFELTLELDDTLEGFGNVCSTGFSGGYIGDEDYYTFETPAGTSDLTIVLDALNNNGNFHIWLYKWNGADWEQVDRIAITQDPKTLAVAADPETMYYFFVAGSKNSPGDYSLEITAGSGS